MGKKKPPCGGFFCFAVNYCLAGSEAAAAGAEASTAGATGAAGAAGVTTAGSVAAGGVIGASGSFLPQAANAAAAMIAANTSDFFIFKRTKVGLRNNFRKLPWWPPTKFSNKKFLIAFC
jgi:hypothetical protein